MTGHRRSACVESFVGSAFSLIEIVISLTIISVIAAVAIPTIQGLDRDQKERAPIQTLAEMVQEVRHRAMREALPYQIVFEREGIHASPTMYAFEKRDEFLKELQNLRTPPTGEAMERTVVERVEAQQQEVVNGPSAGDLAAGAPADEWHWEPPWTLSIPLALGTECEVLMWGDGEWDAIEGEQIRRWVFQPTGVASPARVRLRTGDRELEAGFDVLTGELTRERSAAVTLTP